MTATIVPQLPVPMTRADNSLVTVSINQALHYAEAAHASNTRRGYASDLRAFSKWCARNAVLPLPAAPQTVVLYATDLAQSSKLATVRRHLAAIAFNHREHDLENPVAHTMVRRVVRGIARVNGASQTRKAALTIDALKSVLLEIRGDKLKAKRDRALLILGFSAALRRSEIAALRVTDLAFCKEGLRLRIARSKTDQQAEGVEIAVPFVSRHSLCAVRAVREWLDASEIATGPLFRSFTIRGVLSDSPIDGRDVARLVKKLTGAAHLDGDFSGHSLRAGFATSAARAKVSLDSIARTTRHKSLAVLMTYVRPAQAFDDVALSAMIA